jgi:hypothetical protein
MPAAPVSVAEHRPVHFLRKFIWHPAVVFKSRVSFQADCDQIAGIDGIAVQYSLFVH